MSQIRNYYTQHCQNLKMLEKAIKTVQRTLRLYISFDDYYRSYVYTKLLSHLVNSWVEVRLMKMVYESGAFTNSEKIEILKSKKMEKKWTTALNLAFCRAFNLKNPRNIASQTTVPFTAKSQHQALLKIIQNDLLSSSSRLVYSFSTCHTIFLPLLPPLSHMYMLNRVYTLFLVTVNLSNLEVTSFWLVG
jgi:hypothetical protein